MKREKRIGEIDDLIQQLQSIKRGINSLPPTAADCFKFPGLGQVNNYIDRSRETIRNLFRFRDYAEVVISVTEVDPEEFYNNTRKVKYFNRKKANTRGKETQKYKVQTKTSVQGYDARKLFVILFPQTLTIPLSRYMKVDRSQIIDYRKKGYSLLETDKKFNKDYAEIKKRLNLV
jgi:hypothetical protein